MCVLCDVCSEPEPSVEGAGGPEAPVQPHLGTAALLRAHPDPGVPRLPGALLRLGAAPELVREVDTRLRVSGFRSVPGSVVCRTGSALWL